MKIARALSQLSAGALATLAACVGQAGAPPPDAASEDELRFRTAAVDTSLPDFDGTVSVCVPR